MRKFFLTILCFIPLMSISLKAQLNGDGYYRIQNAHTERYISIVNNKVDSQNKDIWQIANSGAHIYALKTMKPVLDVVSDPGTIMYIIKDGNGYILKAQGMDTKELTNGRELKIYDSRTKAGTYWLYASESSTSVYLKDHDDVLDDTGNIGYALASTSRSEDEVNWNLLPMDGTKEYFGITPEICIDNQYYATLYASFPFMLSDGMKAYYVKNVEGAFAEYVEVAGNIIPAETPIIIECVSSNPADNKVSLLINQQPVIYENLLKGIYFSYVMQSVHGGEAVTDIAMQLRNVIPYDAETMRVLGDVDGCLGFVKTSDLTYLPANKAYLPVSSMAADNIKLVNSDDFAASINALESVQPLDVQKKGVFTLTGVRLRSDSSIVGLPNGMYIINGKKVLIK